METQWQTSLQELTGNLEVLKYLAMILNVLMLGFFYISNDLRENAKVARVGLAVQVAVSALVYQDWLGKGFYGILAVFMIFDWQGICDLRVRVRTEYFGLGFGWTLALGIGALNLAFVLPGAGWVIAPHLVAALVFWVFSRFLVILDKECDGNVAYAHFVTVKYLSAFLSLVQSALVCYGDWKIYPDHVISFLIICFGMFNKNNLLEVIQEIKPKIKKIKSQNYEKIFEFRPICDGEKQVKSPLPYYMDDDGDIANEFYEEVNKTFIKVDTDKLKLV